MTENNEVDRDGFGHLFVMEEICRRPYASARQFQNTSPSFEQVGISTVHKDGSLGWQHDLACSVDRRNAVIKLLNFGLLVGRIGYGSMSSIGQKAASKKRNVTQSGVISGSIQRRDRPRFFAASFAN
jgi:hypothetical protein